VDRAVSTSLDQIIEFDEIDQRQWEDEPFSEESELGFPNHHDLALLIACISVLRRRTVHETCSSGFAQADDDLFASHASLNLIELTTRRLRAHCAASEVTGQCCRQYTPQFHYLLQDRLRDSAIFAYPGKCIDATKAGQSGTWKNPKTVLIIPYQSRAATAIISTARNAAFNGTRSLRQRSLTGRYSFSNGRGCPASMI
jgi:hypothetical protein